ncbi:MAG TPA: hypothetical protein VLT47_03555 [Anaeromyxobacteraceae bacterium]|nr:hypothetical protein [Anaeromyxobacteraceae bacterium]
MKRYLFAAIAALALSATPAHAQQQGGRGGELSLHGIFAYYWGDSGVGIGARYQLPLVPEGILHAQVKDDIALDFGLDFVHANFGQYPKVSIVGYDYWGNPIYGSTTWNDLTWNAFIPTVGILWDFWLTPQFAVYPKLETGVAIGWWSADWDSSYAGWAGPHASAFFIQGAAGAKFKLKNNLALKAEVGSGMLKLGVSFPL